MQFYYVSSLTIKTLFLGLIIKQSKFDRPKRSGLITAIFLDVSNLALFRQSHIIVIF